MKRKDWFIKYSLEFIVIVLGISVSFWLNQVSTNKQNNNERIKVLNSLQKEAEEINDYCAERKKNWQNDIAILNAFINPVNQQFNFETIKHLTKSKSRIQFNLIYYRVFEPPTDRYHSIINSGALKYINSDKIKEMLSRIHITYSSYVQTTIDYEKKLKEDIVPVISKRHPDIIIKKNDNSISTEKYCDIIYNSIQNDRELISTLILLEEYQKNKINWLSMYIVLIEDLETEINKVLSKK
ncbi:MAG: hypothetical protein CMD14_00010 [Flavobacteriales bacterium]|nr:hypothetical protein [Flavobacteriales bacterium]